MRIYQQPIFETTDYAVRNNRKYHYSHMEGGMYPVLIHKETGHILRLSKLQLEEEILSRTTQK